MDKSLLLVEDCPMMTRFLGSYFRQQYRLSAVPNPLAALLWLKTNPTPDAIVLDYNLPEMSGLEMLRHLRQRRSWAEVPVIVLSGVKDMEKRWQCLDAGAQDFLAKPFHPKELGLRIQALFSAKKAALEYA